MIVITGWILFLIGFLLGVTGIINIDILTISVYSGILGILTVKYLLKL